MWHHAQMIQVRTQDTGQFCHYLPSPICLQHLSRCICLPGSAFLVPSMVLTHTHIRLYAHLHLWPCHSKVPDGAGAQGLRHLLELLHLHLSQLLGLAHLQLQLGPSIDQF